MKKTILLFILLIISLNSYSQPNWTKQATGYACGGVIIKATIGGLNWFGTYFPANTMHTINFPNENTGWVCGTYGTVRKTINGGVTPVINLKTEILSSFSLKQNYPNPFNSTTNIIFQIKDSRHGESLTNVKFTVIDVLGKEVATLVNEKLSAGTYEAIWYASQFPSEIYFYRLTAEDYSEIKRSILIK